MDDDLKDLLMKLLDGNIGIETKLNSLYTKVSNLETKFKEGPFRIENQVNIENMLEEVKAEYKEQNEQELKKSLLEELDTNTLIASLLKTTINEVVDVKKDIKELKEKLDIVEKVTMQNTYDIVYLKWKIIEWGKDSL